MSGFFGGQTSSQQNLMANFCSVDFDAVSSPIEISSSFTKIEFSIYDNFAKTDSAGNYDDDNNVYIVPSDGYYQIITSFRLADSPEDPVGFGQGAHTSNADNPYFLWSETNAYRQGSINIRTSFFNQNDEIRMIAFCDPSYNLWRGAMSIIPLGL